MILAPGTKLGPYEILAPIGAGGMGEVYRAHDSRVGRDVAIKVSTEQFNERFEREIRAVASLNHSNICTLYDVGPNYLVMELIEGPILADRIKQGAIPLEESLEIAGQIADALEAAHEKGIVHRDLKPANIKIKPDGTVKVLDFGLAKVGGTPVVSSDNSPTLSVAQTAAGVILGTAAYMSPEQAKGKIVDKRADIWAFGVVLYEMLTGKQLFTGETVSEILAAVIMKEPEWERVPPKVQRLLLSCLQKDPKKRLADISDARLLLEDIPESARAKHPWLAWSVAVTCLLIALAVSVIHFREAPVEAPEMRLQVNTPPTSEPNSFALAPNGRLLVFVALSEGQQRLCLRPLDSMAARPLAGTEGATYPFWSPDSRSIGFFADLKLKRIDVAGGQPQVLASAPDGFGGTWSRDGFIVFTPTVQAPLYRVPAGGGDPVAITRLDTRTQSAHRFPQFLPDGRHLLFFGEGADQGIYLASLDSAETKRLFEAESAAAYTPSGHLLFMRQGSLFAQRFDAERGQLAGDPVRVADSVALGGNLGFCGFSVSETSMLAYRTGGGVSRTQLAWFDRSGKEVGTLGAPDENGLWDPELSSDGRRVAGHRQVQGNTDVWLIEIGRGVATRFTFDAAADGWPIWSPDGSRIVFSSNRKGTPNLYQKTSSGAGIEEMVLETSLAKSPCDWSPDGRFLLYAQYDAKTSYGLWVLPLFGERKPFPFVNTSFEENLGQFSPDGRWVAYESNESGKFEVYVRPFPGPGGKWQVSTGSGIMARWRRDGKELFYIAPDGKLMAAPIHGEGQTLEAGTPIALFQTRILGGGLSRRKQQYAVAPDGQRFLINITVDESAASPITIITNWTAGLKK